MNRKVGRNKGNRVKYKEEKRIRRKKIGGNRG